MDMASGGGRKVKDLNFIYIEAPTEQAIQFFARHFGHDPENTTCACCGQDYSISEEVSLAQATAFERNCEYDQKSDKYIERQREDNLRIRKQCGISSSEKWGLYIPLKDFVKLQTVRVIRKQDMKRTK